MAPLRRARGGMASGGAGAGALDALASPDLAHLSAVGLLARLLRPDRRGSDVADVALVLNARERRLAEAEDRSRAADEVIAGLRDTIRELELRAASAEDRARAADEVAAALRDTIRELELRADNAEDRARASDEVAAGLRDTIRKLELRVAASAEAEALARNSAALGSESGGITIIGGEHMVVASEDHQPSQAQAGLELQIGRVSELTAGEIRARDLTTGDNEITTIVVVPELPPPAGDIEATAGKRKKEPAAAFASEPEEEKKEDQPLKKKPKTPGALFDVAEEASNKQELCFTEAQGWEKLDVIKAQVAAWEAEYDAADAAAAAQGTLQAAAAPSMDVEKVQALNEQQAHHESGRRVASDEHDHSRLMIPEVEAGRVVSTGALTSDMEKKKLVLVAGNGANEEGLKKQAAVTHGSKPPLRSWWSRQQAPQSVEKDSGERKLDKI